MGNYHKKQGKDKLPLICGDGKWVIPIYGCGRSSSNKLINLPKRTDPEPSVCMNEKNQFQIILMKTIALIKVHHNYSDVHVITVIRIKIIPKEQCMSHLFIQK